MGTRRCRRGTLVAMAGIAVVTLVVTGCGRADGETETGVGGGDPAASSAPAEAAPGDFGSETGICGEGDASGATGRGVTDDTITVGTFGDPGSTVTPGLGQEFFDVGAAFVAWCNEAGGINGRQIELVEHDAKLTDAGARILDACGTDFMLVGGGTVGDAAMTAPRLACGLGQIPAYSVSPEAGNAGLQVIGSQNPPDEYPVGAWQALVEMFPGSEDAAGVGGSSFATIRSQGLRLRQALTQLGYDVTGYNEMPPLVSNYRPFMEEMKAAGVLGYQPIGIQDPTPLFTAMSNVGWDPNFVLTANQLYDPVTVAALSGSDPPATWVFLDHAPFEMADEIPVVRQAVDVVAAVRPDAKLTDFTALGLSSWVLWAKSATACGDDLTVECVLDKAGQESAWTAGGLYSPRDIRPGHAETSRCFLLLKVSSEGFAYDEEATKPNEGIYNCDEDNVVTLENTFE